MKTELVSFKTAYLGKEKSFNLPTLYWQGRKFQILNN